MSHAVRNPNPWSEPFGSRNPPSLSESKMERNPTGQSEPKTQRNLFARSESNSPRNPARESEPSIERNLPMPKRIAYCEKSGWYEQAIIV